MKLPWQNRVNEAIDQLKCIEGDDQLDEIIALLEMYYWKRERLEE